MFILACLFKSFFVGLCLDMGWTQAVALQLNGHCFCVCVCVCVCVCERVGGVGGVS